MSEEMMFSKFPQAIKLSESQLPIVLSALETDANGQTVAELKDITIKMPETRRRRPDTSEVYHADGPFTGAEPEEEDGDDQEEDDLEEPEIERSGENGEVFILRPKRAPNERNAPGDALTAAKGAINQFRGIPNNHPKGMGGKHGLSTMREPGHFWRQRPEPFRQTLPGANKGSTFGKKGDGKGKTGPEGKYLLSRWGRRPDAR